MRWREGGGDGRGGGGGDEEMEIQPVIGERSSQDGAHQGILGEGGEDLPLPTYLPLPSKGG